MMLWYMKFPRDAYALGPIALPNMRAVREWARWFSGCKRLPRGFQAWKAR